MQHHRHRGDGEPARSAGGRDPLEAHRRAAVDGGPVVVRADAARGAALLRGRLETRAGRAGRHPRRAAHRRRRQRHLGPHQRRPSDAAPLRPPPFSERRRWRHLQRRPGALRCAACYVSWHAECTARGARDVWGDCEAGTDQNLPSTRQGCHVMHACAPVLVWVGIAEGAAHMAVACHAGTTRSCQYRLAGGLERHGGCGERPKVQHAVVRCRRWRPRCGRRRRAAAR